MKGNLRSACLLFLVLFLFIVGFISLVSANDDTYNYNTHFNNPPINPSKYGILENIPKGDYPIWGYTNKTYNFCIEYNSSGENLSNTVMVFYWNCLRDPSNYTYFKLENKSHFNNNKGNCSKQWNLAGNYNVAVGVFKPGSKKVSYWIPIEIYDEANITVKSVQKLDKNGSYKELDKYGLYNENSNYSKEPYHSKYCGYVNNDYSFLVNHSAEKNPNCKNYTKYDYYTIDETTTEVNWHEENSTDNQVYNFNDDKRYNLSNISDILKPIEWNKSFTHSWSYTGEKNISVRAFHWDPFDWEERNSNFFNNTSILIIRDPKNFFLSGQKNLDSMTSLREKFLTLITKPFSNLQNVGIFLIVAGLVILFFAFTKNHVPVKIAILGLKPFYLKSVDFFIGTFTFVTGMYLYFVFSRCPWDIPIISTSTWLSDAYFSMLLYEYPSAPNKNIVAIPYLSILLFLVVVFSLSMILYRIGIPYISEESKSGYLSRQKVIIVLRSSITWFSLLFKKLSIQMKENIRRINVTDGKVTGLQSESGKKEKM
jgi:hypothetical protein